MLYVLVVPFIIALGGLLYTLGEVYNLWTHKETNEEEDL